MPGPPVTSLGLEGPLQSHRQGFGVQRQRLLPSQAWLVTVAGAGLPFIWGKFHEQDHLVLRISL